MLLVENETDISRLISFVLADQGFEVTCVGDAASAEAKLQRESFDVILLDLMLPGEDGYSFCRRLKGMERLRDIPVIIISARTMPEEIRKGMDAGAAAYITKPYNPITLPGEIREVVERHRKTQG